MIIILYNDGITLLRHSNHNVNFCHYFNGSNFHWCNKAAIGQSSLQCIKVYYFLYPLMVSDSLRPLTVI